MIVTRTSCTSCQAKGRPYVILRQRVFAVESLKISYNATSHSEPKWLPSVGLFTSCKRCVPQEQCKVLQVMLQTSRPASSLGGIRRPTSTSAPIICLDKETRTNICTPNFRVSLCHRDVDNHADILFQCISPILHSGCIDWSATTNGSGRRHS